MPDTAVPVHVPSPRYQVVIDPTSERRGHCEPAVDGIYRAGRIVLRRWDEEVFLHECLHALLASGRFVVDLDHPRVAGEEEAVVAQLSHGLFEMGWRYDGERPRPIQTAGPADA